MKTLLIFGAGWLGSKMLHALSEDGQRIIVATRDLNNKTAFPGVEYVQIKIDDKSVRVSFVNEYPTGINQLLLMLPPSGWVNYEKSISSIVGMYPNCEQLIYTSSTSVYQEKIGSVNEESMVKPEHPVFLAEQVVKRYYPHNHIILRLAGLIGSDRHPVKFLLKKESVDNGLAPVNLIHRKDIIHAMFLIIRNAETSGVYNLCYPKHPLKATYYNLIAKQLFKKQIRFFDGIGGKEIDGSKFALHYAYDYQFDICDINNFTALK